jgi:hypothetical protein
MTCERSYTAATGSGTPPAWVQHVAAAFPDLYGRVMLGISVGAADAAKIAELAGLLDAANGWKQAGFYSDFDPDSGSWSSPGSVTEADFAKIRALIGEYVSETQRQLDDVTRYRAAGQAATGS